MGPGGLGGEFYFGLIRRIWGHTLRVRITAHRALRGGGRPCSFEVNDSAGLDRGRDTGTGPPEEATERPKVDVKKVAAALERFNAISSRITKEQLDEEQKRMLEAKEKLSAIEAPEPSAREIVDERGFQWVELTYPSGEVRYELPQARP